MLKLPPGKALNHEVRALGVQAPAVFAPQSLRRLLHLSPRLLGQPGDADDEACKRPVGEVRHPRPCNGGGPSRGG